MRKQISGAAPLRINSGVIRDEADVPVPQRRKFLRLQNIEPGLNASWPARMLRAAIPRACDRRSTAKRQRE
jgi:hypothetical protein